MKRAAVRLAAAMTMALAGGVCGAADMPAGGIVTAEFPLAGYAWVIAKAGNASYTFASIDDLVEFALYAEGVQVPDSLAALGEKLAEKRGAGVSSGGNGRVAIVRNLVSPVRAGEDGLTVVVSGEAAKALWGEGVSIPAAGTAADIRMAGLALGGIAAAGGLSPLDRERYSPDVWADLAQMIQIFKDGMHHPPWDNCPYCVLRDNVLGVFNVEAWWSELMWIIEQMKNYPPEDCPYCVLPEEEIKASSGEIDGWGSAFLAGMLYGWGERTDAGTLQREAAANLAMSVVDLAGTQTHAVGFRDSAVLVREIATGDEVKVTVGF